MDAIDAHHDFELRRQEDLSEAQENALVAEQDRRLARYDEAIELLRLAYDSKYQREKVRTIEQVDDLEARAMAFLAAEGKVAG